MKDNTQKCPFCNQTIDINAKVCKHCDGKLLYRRAKHNSLLKTLLAVVLALLVTLGIGMCITEKDKVTPANSNIETEATQ